jgi:hypothetical protein
MHSPWKDLARSSMACAPMAALLISSGAGNASAAHEGYQKLSNGRFVGSPSICYLNFNFRTRRA